MQFSSLIFFNQKNDQIDSIVYDSSQIDSLDIAAKRIRELEMDLAQSKVSQVETECHNETLKHQLNTMHAKNTAGTPNNNNNPTANQTWRSKWDNLTTNVATNVSIPTFQSHISNFAHQLNSFDETK